MASTKHTPGPWEIYTQTEDKIYWAPRIRNVNDQLDIATAYGGLAHGQQEANAKLIAAAPELLAMLKKYVSAAWKGFNENVIYDIIKGNPDSVLAEAVALIEKASGEKPGDFL